MAIRYRKDMETPATSTHVIKTMAEQLTGLRMVIDRLAQASETLMARAAENGNGTVDPDTEARLAKHASLQSDLLAEYKEMFGTLSAEASRVLLEMLRLATSDIRNYYDENGDPLPVNSLSDDAAAAVAGVKIVNRQIKDENGEVKREIRSHEFKLWDKPKAAALMGKHLGLLKDVVQHSGPGGGPIEIHTSTIPIDKLSIEGKMQILEILERELGDGMASRESAGAIDAESRPANPKQQSKVLMLPLAD